MSVEELYLRDIRSLPATERIKLAALILNDLAREPGVDYSDDWSDEDLHDFAQSTWQHIDAVLAESDHAKAG